MKNKIIFGDSREKLKEIKSDSIGLIITSPPYKDEDGFSFELMEEIFKECFRILRKDTLFFLNFGHLAKDKSRPFKVCMSALRSGFELNDTIVWVKNHYKPIQGNKRLNNLTEFIFLLYKGKMPKLNRLAIGVPYSDKSNAERYNGGEDLRCGGNVWNIKYPTITKSSQKKHHDRFPAEFPERCIKLCGYDIGTVIDPFCGSGTVCVTAKKLGVNFIGIEKSREHYQTALAEVNSITK